MSARSWRTHSSRGSGVEVEAVCTNCCDSDNAQRLADACSAGVIGAAAQQQDEQESMQVGECDNISLSTPRGASREAPMRSESV